MELGEFKFSCSRGCVKFRVGAVTILMRCVLNRIKANFQNPNSAIAQPKIANVRFGTKNDFAHPPIVDILI